MKKINYNGRVTYVLPQNFNGSNYKELLLHELMKKLSLIARNNPEGFTVQLPDCEPVTSGFVVSYAATQNSFGRKGLQRALNHALSHNGVIGGWLNKDNGKYYFDSSIVFNNKEDAIAFGIENQQLAVFDLNNMQEIEVNELINKQ